MFKKISLITICLLLVLSLVSCAYKDYSKRDIKRVANRYCNAELLSEEVIDEKLHNVNYYYYDSKEDIEFTVYERHDPISIDGSTFGYDNDLLSDYQAVLTKKYLDLYEGSISGKFKITYSEQAYLAYEFNTRAKLEDEIKESEDILAYLKKCNRNTSLQIAYNVTYSGPIKYNSNSFYKPNEIREIALFNAIYFQKDMLSEYGQAEIENYLSKNPSRVYIKINNQWISTNGLANDRGTNSTYENGKTREYGYATISTKAFIKLLENIGYEVDFNGSKDLYVYKDSQLIGQYEFNDLSNSEVFFYDYKQCCGLDIAIYKWLK